MFATERYKLVVHDETQEACQLFDRELDPWEDINLVRDAGRAGVLEEMMAAYVRPFFQTEARAPAERTAGAV